MQTSAPITVVGSINRDLVVGCDRLPLLGETVTGRSLSYGGGGKGANQALAAARLGGKVAMIGRVGDDIAGAEARAALASAGCDTGGVRAIGDETGQAIVLVQDDGANSIVLIEGANGRFDARELDRDSARLNETGILLLQLETPAETVVKAAAIARAAGSQTILDPAPAAAMPASLFAMVDIVTPNQTELAALVGSALHSSADIAEAARTLRACGPATVIVKMGADGCLLLDNGRALLIAAPRVAAVDTTGAGDVFNAALAVALAEGRAMPAACAFAVKAAALSVTRAGAQSAAPSREEVDMMLDAQLRSDAAR